MKIIPSSFSSHGGRAMLLLVAFLFVFATTEAADLTESASFSETRKKRDDGCTPNGGEWAEWKILEGCPDYCGNCGTRKKTRECKTEATCPCIGESVRLEPCNTEVCNYPRLSCCPGKSAQVIDKRHTCGPVAGLVKSNIEVKHPPNVKCDDLCCPEQGIWGEWKVSTPCKNSCGSCGMEQRTRVCLSETYGCPCTGKSTKEIVCGTQTCVFPRPSCCAPYKPIADKTTHKFICGPLPVEPPEPEIIKTTCCGQAKKGLFNEWSEWTRCTADCGLCGKQTRTRSCASEAYGCSCDAAEKTTDERDCGNPVCGGAKKPCCNGEEKVAYDGQKFCRLKEEPDAACSAEGGKGEWTEWASYGVCSDYCGMCGKMQKYRYCLPPGCKCEGEHKEEVDCGTNICLFPRPSCCKGYRKSVSEKKYVCSKTK